MTRDKDCAEVYTSAMKTIGIGLLLTAAASAQMKDMSFEGNSEVLEAEVCGQTAWCRTHLVVTVTPAGGKPVRRSGYTLSILRKSPGGKWQLYRDTNLLTVEG